MRQKDSHVSDLQDGRPCRCHMSEEGSQGSSKRSCRRSWRRWRWSWRREGAAKKLAPLLKPKLLPYARKKELAKEQACVLEEAFPAAAEAKVVEWLGDLGTSRHVCTDMSMMWDIVERTEPVVLRQLVEELKVYTTGTVKLQC